MSTEPITGLTYQEPGSLQTDALQNAELNYFGAWLNCAVLTIGDAAPPGSPANGDCYIVGTGTGAWATHDDELAVYRDGWQFYVPKEGDSCVNLDDGFRYVYLSGVWDTATVLGVGDVNGPASSTDSNVALFDGVTGKLLKDGGVLPTLSSLQGTGLDVDAAGFRGIPQNSQSGNYTCVAADAGKEIYHPSGAGAGDTFTIPANGSVAYEIGTAITFTNMDSSALSIAITTDALYLAGAGTTGTRTLAQYGTAVAVKKTSTTWLISGINLT